MDLPCVDRRVTENKFVETQQVLAEWFSWFETQQIPEKKLVESHLVFAERLSGFETGWWIRILLGGLG